MTIAAAAADSRPISDIEILQDLNRGYIRSVEFSDVRWFDDNLADDFLNTNPDATLVDRAGFLAQIGRKSPVTNIRGSDVRILIRGDFAFIHARTTYIKPDGQQGAGRYTDVWWKRNQRWMCVSAHVTRA